MKVEARHADGTQYDFESTDNNLTLAPGATYNYSSTRTFPKTGSYTIKLMNFREAQRWSATYPTSETSSIERQVDVSVKDAVTVVQGLELSSTSVGAGESVTATFQLQNFSNQAVNVGRIKVEGRHSDGTQYDFSSTENNLVIEPGETYTYNESRSFPRAGTYRLMFMNFREVQKWSATYPQSENSSAIRTASLTVQ